VRPVVSASLRERAHLAALVRDCRPSDDVLRCGSIDWR
jgi:hypothetical protein